MLKDQAARTVSRRELEHRYAALGAISPDIGLLDDAALGRLLDESPDEGVSLLSQLARATDQALREKARRLAAQLLLPLSRQAAVSQWSGAVRLVRSKRQGVDLDVDAVVEAVAARGKPEVPADELSWLRWERPGRAYVLVVDASDSVSGAPLTNAVVTASALAARCGPDDELAVIAFWSRALVLRPISSPEPRIGVLDSLFDLRGGDTTDLAAGLRAALAQASLAGCGRRDIVVLTDGIATTGDDPGPVAAVAAASGVTVHVLAVGTEPEQIEACRAISDAGGGRTALLRTVSEASASLAEVLS